MELEKGPLPSVQFLQKVPGVNHLSPDVPHSRRFGVMRGALHVHDVVKALVRGLIDRPLAYKIPAPDADRGLQIRVR